MTEKNAFWTKETKIALVILVLFSGLMAYLILGDNVSSHQASNVSAANSRETTEYVEEPTQDLDYFETDYGSVGGSSAPISAHSNPAVAATSEYSESVTVQWLIMELRRLIRAGRSMEALRNSDNLTLTRRCLDGMQRLQKQSRSIMSKGGSLPLPTEPPSINSVLSKIRVCTSCGSAARQSCSEADRDLTMIEQGATD
ncbi:MAG: hypothetical protein BMS9Abin05_0034 [Rhodothermia bacterium]|nr:MAG: hypothetical protein BMS9Abin05_0034 [Rhodothermia bacterium]